MSTTKAAGRPHRQGPATLDTTTPANTNEDHGEGNTNGHRPDGVDLFDLAPKVEDRPACPKHGREELDEVGEICLAEGCDWMADDDLDAKVAALKAEAAALLDDQDQLPEGITVDDDGTVHYRYKGDGLALTLSADHWRELVEKSSIDPALVVARGYWSLDGSDQAQKFLRKNGITPKAQDPEHFPGLLLFMHPLTDNGLRVQWKPATPLLGRDGKPQKYLSQAKMPNALDVHPLRHEAAKDPSVRLWIGEGVKKGDSLASRGETVVSLTGVWNWRNAKGPLPDWEEIPLKDREILIDFDSDA